MSIATEAVKCKCCGEVKITDRCLRAFTRLQKYHISSVYRCKKHNSDPSVGGSPKSQHLTGNAIDIHYPENPREIKEFLADIVECSPTYIIWYKWGLHIDWR